MAAACAGESHSAVTVTTSESPCAADRHGVLEILGASPDPGTAA